MTTFADSSASLFFVASIFLSVFVSVVVVG